MKKIFNWKRDGRFYWKDGLYKKVELSNLKKIWALKAEKLIFMK